MKKVRCAIYSRKSSEEGLQQEFNSLHAQREACEAYVLSQAGEGWEALRDVFDDGGFSGGNMERPGLRRLLDAVESGRVDVVVVYKVDRLTRSLTDFARIIEILDAKTVSFVSVTQAFNTTTSMGRLTLNVLLSFAQFEREVTSERIRDKIAASKAKGIWMGGMIPLGYDLLDRRLLINTAEAETIRDIFHRYLELSSVGRLCVELRDKGLRSKRWRTTSGNPLGGGLLTRGAVFHILQNRLYAGQIEHKGRVYPGRHEAIVPGEVFEAVQARLQEQKAQPRQDLSLLPAPTLAGRIFNAAGEVLSPSFAYGRRGRRYRYYIAMDLQTGLRTRMKEGPVQRVSAAAVEQFLVDLFHRLMPTRCGSVDDLGLLVQRVELHAEETQVVVCASRLFRNAHHKLELQKLKTRLGTGEMADWERSDQSALRLVLPVQLRRRGGRHHIEGAKAPARSGNKPLAKALSNAHRQLRELNASPVWPSEMNSARAPETQHARQLAKLAFLAPDIQARLLTGEHRSQLTLRTLLRAEPPLAWEDQRAWFEALT